MTLNDEPAHLDTSRPQSARVWNYWLGGKDAYEADRTLGDAVLAVYPGMRTAARQSRAFLGRAVHYLAAEAGIRQFLDVGTGLPTADNTHEIAQRVNPDARVVYVDNDPLVLSHARALLTSTPEGVTDYIDADLHQPYDILAQATELLDFGQPIALLLMGVLGHAGVDPDDPLAALIDANAAAAAYAKARHIINVLMDELPPASYLALYDFDNSSPQVQEAGRVYGADALPYLLRTREQIAGYFTGLELVEPGLVRPQQWRPTTLDTTVDGDGDDVPVWCGVARKPARTP